MGESTSDDCCGGLPCLPASRECGGRIFQSDAPLGAEATSLRLAAFRIFTLPSLSQSHAQKDQMYQRFCIFRGVEDSTRSSSNLLLPSWLGKHIQYNDSLEHERYVPLSVSPLQHPLWLAKRRAIDPLKRARANASLARLLTRAFLRAITRLRASTSWRCRGLCERRCSDLYLLNSFTYITKCKARITHSTILFNSSIAE